MELEECLAYLVDEIHTVVIATVDESGRPQTRAIDLLGYDDQGIYLSTGAGKAFCRELETQGYLSLTGMSGSSTMKRVAVSVRGEVRPESAERTGELLAANPYMLELYPTPESRATVRLFCLHKGVLDWYDLRTRPYTILQFTFGGVEIDERARLAGLRRRLIDMLLLETPDGSSVDVPADASAQEALAERLVAGRDGAPMSADLFEVYRLYQDLRTRLS